MKIKLYILGSLLSGLLLTCLFVAAGGWSSNVECGYEVYPKKEEARYRLSDFKPCAAMRYGYPQRFVTAKPHLELNLRAGETIALNDFEPSATVIFDKSSFLSNWATWSGLSLIVFMALGVSLQPVRWRALKRRKK